MSDGCCSAPEANGLIALGLGFVAAYVYWRQSKWIVGEARAVSGHTIAVGKNETKVRLHALYSLQPGQEWYDAAGTKHDGGAIAKGMLAQQVSGKKVKVHIEQGGEKSFKRTIGQVFVDCEDVGLWMIANGYAFADKEENERKRNQSLLRKYRKAQKKAERKNLGFHTGRNEDPHTWIKDKIAKQYNNKGYDPEKLAKSDSDLFLKIAEEIATEIGQEMFNEIASEFLLMALA